MRLPWLLFILPCTFLGTGPYNAHAQAGIDNQLWSDLTLTHYFSARWHYSGDMGFRTSLSNSNWRQAYVRPTFVFHVNPSVDVRAGISLFQTWNKSAEDQLELRWHQEINLRWPQISGFIFQHMLRAEERFFYNEVSENDFSARLRYRPTIETPDFIRVDGWKRMYVSLGIDVFLPLGKASPELFVNNYRLQAGVGYRFSEVSKLEIIYFRQRSRALTEDGFKTSENVVRIRFFLTLKKRPSSD